MQMGIEAEKAADSSNRTFMELKFDEISLDKQEISGSNRTFMELK